MLTPKIFCGILQVYLSLAAKKGIGNNHLCICTSEFYQCSVRFICYALSLEYILHCVNNKVGFS
nr:MAG TPA: hypothetical protein [Caudoviricetes sp.]